MILKRGSTQRQNVNVHMHIETSQMIALLCCFRYDEKQRQTLFFWLLQQYDTFTKDKMVNE